MAVSLKSKVMMLSSVGSGEERVRERERENGDNKEERQKNREICLQFLPETESYE